MAILRNCTLPMVEMDDRFILPQAKMRPAVRRPAAFLLDLSLFEIISLSDGNECAAAYVPFHCPVHPDILCITL